MTNKAFVIEKKQGGGYVVNKYEPTYDPLANTDIDVDISTNSYLVPDYSTKGGKYLHPDNIGNVIRIEMSGDTRAVDFLRSNAEMKKLNPSFIPDNNYTWHHLDDFEFDSATGKYYCTMQYVLSSAHGGGGVSGMAHSGSVAQYAKYTGIQYKN